MPTLRVAEDPALNAFSTGLTQKQYSITVMRGLMNALDDAEMESVLGHELTHIRNGDVQMMVVAVVIAGAISFFGELVFRLFFQASFYGGSASADAAATTRGRRRRSRHCHRAGADRGDLDPVGRHPVRAVARARISCRRRLRRTHEKSRRHDLGAAQDRRPRRTRPRATSAVMELCIDNPREGFSNIFDTHPSVEDRVAAIIKFAGGHDPGPLALERRKRKRPQMRLQPTPVPGASRRSSPQPNKARGDRSRRPIRRTAAPGGRTAASVTCCPARLASARAHAVVGLLRYKSMISAAAVRAKRGQ